MNLLMVYLDDIKGPFDPFWLPTSYGP